MNRWLLLVSSLVVACAGEEAPAPPPAAAEPAPEAAADPRDELEAMDRRTPVPLLPMMAAHQREQMRDHLAVVQEVTSALARDDLEAAATAAARLGTSDSMTAMCTHMGAGAPGFTEQALEMHRRADGVARAARAGDRAGTLAALSETLSSCTGCHATYRQQIVDQERWSALTGGGAPSHPHH